MKISEVVVKAPRGATDPRTEPNTCAQDAGKGQQRRSEKRARIPAQAA